MDDPGSGGEMEVSLIYSLFDIANDGSWVGGYDLRVRYGKLN